VRLIDSGALRVSVPADGSAIARGVDAGGRRLLGPIPLPDVDVTGEAPAGFVPQPTVIETQGPVRTELLLRGTRADGATYEARLAAFAGLPALRARVTLAHMGSAPYLPLRAMTLAIPATFTAGETGVAGSTRRFDRVPGERHTLRQEDAGQALLDGSGAGGHADCWMRARNDAAAVTIVSPLCWQQYPQELRLGKDGLRLGLFAGAADPVRLGRGAAKTHEVWIAVQPSAAATAPEDLATALAVPLVAHVDAGWVVSTRALAQALDPRATGAASFLDRLSAGFTRYQKRARSESWDDGPPVPCQERTSERPRVGYFGALNWGDWNFPGYRDHREGCDAWGNLEYDLPQVLGLGWVATGKREFFDGFAAAALHYRDVDIVHHDPEHPDHVGLNHPHKAGHFAPESPKNVDLGHTWLEGLITHYRLTGDPRSLAAARAMGDALAGRVGKAANPRHFGWPMIALAALADSTGETRYRDAASHFATAGLDAWEPSPAAADWKIGILADGLAAVHAVDGEPRLLDWLTRYADALVTAPPDRFPDARYALPLGYLAARSGDRRYRERALAVAAALTIGDWGKALALGGRTGFRLLGPLATQQPAAARTTTPAPAAPLRRSEPARRRP
jgi:hypothetical protein